MWLQSVAHADSWLSWTRGALTSPPVLSSCRPASRWELTIATATVRTNPWNQVRSTSSSCWLNSVAPQGWVKLLLRSRVFSSAYSFEATKVLLDVCLCYLFMVFLLDFPAQRMFATSAYTDTVMTPELAVDPLPIETGDGLIWVVGPVLAVVFIICIVIAILLYKKWVGLRILLLSLCVWGLHSFRFPTSNGRKLDPNHCRTHDDCPTDVCICNGCIRKTWKLGNRVPLFLPKMDFMQFTSALPAYKCTIGSQVLVFTLWPEHFLLVLTIPRFSPHLKLNLLFLLGK